MYHSEKLKRCTWVPDPLEYRRLSDRCALEIPKNAGKGADFFDFDPKISDFWAKMGDFEPKIDHFDGQIAEVRSYDQARDALAAGLILLGGSDQLFSDVRDRFGFCFPRGLAFHRLALRGFSDNARRPGLVVQTYFGPDHPYGPRKVTLPHGKQLELPVGAFLIDAEVFDGMYREFWAVSECTPGKP
jgi:hypothetical protein